MRKTRFAILGFGHHAARRLAPAFALSSEATLAGLWRRNAEAARTDAEKLQIHSFETAEALCASPDVDAVFITSPDALHLADARLAFAHGKAVLCEKPVAMNAGEAAEMQNLASAASLLFGVAQNFRFNRSLEYLRDQIAAGRIGVPQFARAEFCYSGNLAPRRWITDPTLASGGPIADVGVHCVDALRFILGAEVKSINTLASKDALSGEVEAFASMQMAMSSGIFADVSVSARSPYRTLLEVRGSEGVFVSENGLSVDRPIDVVLRRGGEIIDTKTISNEDGYIRMIDAFSRAYRGEGTFSSSGVDGLINQRILDASYRSWHSGNRELL